MISAGAAGQRVRQMHTAEIGFGGSQRFADRIRR